MSHFRPAVGVEQSLREDLESWRRKFAEFNKDYVALKTDNERLRALVKSIDHCSFCRASVSKQITSDPHLDNCPAFYPNGDVR